MGDIAKMPVHRADRLRWAFQSIAFRRLHHLIPWQKRHQTLTHSHNRIARPTPTVRNTPGFVEIIVHSINPEGTEVDPAGNGVHIGTVHIDEPAVFVHQLGNLAEMEFEYARGIRIGDHDAGHSPPIACQ